MFASSLHETVALHDRCMLTLQLHVQVMVTAHSWGENVFRNFLGWVERKDDGWTEKHIAAYVNIAGCVLGVPKVPISSRGSAG